MLVLLDVDATDADASGDEGVWCDGRLVGFTTSGAYGHYVGRSLALAYVDRDVAVDQPDLVVDVVGEPRPARILVEPPLRPAGDAVARRRGGVDRADARRAARAASRRWPTGSPTSWVGWRRVGRTFSWWRMVANRRGSCCSCPDGRVPRGREPAGPVRGESLSGLGGAVAYFMLFRSLAIGPMSVASPLSALTSAIVPVLAGIAFGEQLSAVDPGSGSSSGLAPFLLVSRQHEDTPHPVTGKVVAMSLTAGGLHRGVLHRAGAVTGRQRPVALAHVPRGRGPGLTGAAVRRTRGGTTAQDVVSWRWGRRRWTSWPPRRSCSPPARDCWRSSP